MNRMQELFHSFGATICPEYENPSARHVRSNFSTEWIDKYFQENFATIDPIVQFAVSHRRTNAAKTLSADEMASPLFEEAKSFNADSNVVITDFYGGSIMVFGGSNQEFDDRIMPRAVQSCKIEHRNAIASRISNLTEKQIDILELKEMGHSDQEVCFELGISASAVSQRKQSVCTKLGLSRFQVALQTYSRHKWHGLIA